MVDIIVAWGRFLVLYLEGGVEFWLAGLFNIFEHDSRVQNLEALSFPAALSSFEVESAVEVGTLRFYCLPDGYWSQRWFTRSRKRASINDLFCFIIYKDKSITTYWNIQHWFFFSF